MDIAAETPDRRAGQRDRLIACAEAAIAAEGLAGLRARRLADCARISVGAIYNLVADLDELTLRVAERTLAALEARLDAVAGGDTLGIELLVDWALAYCAFAAEHRNRWRALFEHRLPTGRDLPPWFAADQLRLLARLERVLASALPDLDPAALSLRTRTLFSAVHGIVTLGLEEKLVAMPVAAVEAELATFVRAYMAGARTDACMGRPRSRATAAQGKHRLR